MEKSPFTELHSARLDLKPHLSGVAYAQKLYRLIDLNRERFKVFMPMIYAVKNVQDEQDFLESCLQKWEKQEEANYAIYLKNTDKIIGCIGVFDIDYNDGFCETGYWLDEHSVGKGYIQEAIKTIEDDFFARGIQGICIKTHEKNIRSQNAALKSGYIYQETKNYLLKNTFSENEEKSTIFMKLKTDWLRQRS